MKWCYKTRSLVQHIYFVFVAEFNKILEVCIILLEWKVLVLLANVKSLNTLNYSVYLVLCLLMQVKNLLSTWTIIATATPVFIP